MEDSGDILYLIVMLVAAVIGVLGSRKKKPQPTEILGPPVPLEEWLPDNPVEEVVLPSVNREKKKARKPEVTVAPVRKYQPARQEDSPRMEVLENDSPAVSLDGLQDIDEVKKAIIYSEIFNRKY